jgi:hypothetical protein
MVAGFKIAVKARPVTASKFTCFKLYLRTREETLPASARFVNWERRDFGSAVSTPPKGFGGATCGRYGLEVAVGKAFNVSAPSTKKLNESYAAIGKVSRWPLVHLTCAKHFMLAEESTQSMRVK